MPGAYRKGKPFAESAVRKRTYESLVRLLGDDERSLFRLQCLYPHQRQRLLYALNYSRGMKKLARGDEPDVDIRLLGLVILNRLGGVK